MKKRKSKPATKGKIKGGDAPMAMPDSPTGEREDYEAKDALRTLVRGHEIQGNKHLMKRVKHHAKREREAHERVLRLEGKPL